MQEGDTPPYDPRRPNAPRWSPGPETLETAEMSALEDVDGARRMFAKVIHLALKDLRYLQAADAKAELSATDRKKMRKIADGVHPQDFINSPWFEEMCALAGVSPDLIRARL